MTSGDENHEDDVDMVEAILRLMVVGGLLVAVVLAAGCASMGRATTTEIETRVGTDQGKPTNLVIKKAVKTEEETRAGPDPEVMKILVQEAVKAAVPGAEAIAAMIPKPPPTKVFGMDPETIAGAAGALWAGERGVAVYHKRRRLKAEAKA